MMKRRFGSLFSLIVVLLVVAFVLPAAAQTENQATFVASEDITLDQTAASTNRNTYPLQLAWSVGPSASTPTKVFLLKFNIGSDPLAGNAVAKARLNLATIGSPCGNPAAPNSVIVYGTSSSSWSETSATWNSTGPGANSIRGSQLDVSDSTLPPTGHAYWTDNANGAFAQYIEAARTGNGGIVSLWVEMDPGSPISTAQFENRERTGQANNCVGANLAPSLQLADAGQPLAVDMKSAAAQQTTSWPLYAGLAAVALFVVAGVVISRRRTA